MDVVIAHPNGWGTREQGVLRSSAVAAGLVREKAAYRRISFLPEAEASIQFCVNSASLAASLEVDISRYVIVLYSILIDLLARDKAYCMRRRRFDSRYYSL